MTEEGDDKSLMALIGGILGGKRFESFSVVAPPLVEAANSVEARISAEAANSEVPPVPAIRPEPPPPALNLPAEENEVEAREGLDAAKGEAGFDGKFALTADRIAELIEGELRKLEGFPDQGVTVTIYGYHYWNVLMAFGPSAVKLEDANRFRQALPDIVMKVRQHVVLAD